jgi:hypothetical protein
MRQVLPLISLFGVFIVGCGGEPAAPKEAPKALYEDPSGVGMPKDYQKLMTPPSKPAQSK